MRGSWTGSCFPDATRKEHFADLVSCDLEFGVILVLIHGVVSKDARRLISGDPLHRSARPTGSLNEINKSQHRSIPDSIYTEAPRGSHGAPDMRQHLLLETPQCRGLPRPDLRLQSDNMTTLWLASFNTIIMRHYNWLRNTLRNKLQRTFVGKALLNVATSAPQSICFVSATRLAEKDFWSKSLLGRSLRPRLNQTTVKARIAYENKRGLPEVYNEAIHEETSDILVFLHDDLWLEDAQLMQKIRTALKLNDVVGVAGNVRRVPGQPAWLFLQGPTGKLELDRSNLSGSVKHGKPGAYTNVNYGPHPATCKLMDGVFLAAKRKTLTSSNAYFDTKFKFDFYDMDFCRTARNAGLSLTTWPIDLIHKSSGAFAGDSWNNMKSEYFKKWKT